MRIKELNKEKSKELFDAFILNNIPSTYYDELDSDYKEIRKDLFEIHDDCHDKYDYEYDLSFSLKIYDYFNGQVWFNETVASNYDFWRYLCVSIIPEIIIQRHGKVASYFYEKNVRMYIPTLWWYIHLTFQGSIEKTYDCLKGFNTDYILQLVERPGREGTYIQISREIFNVLSKLPPKIINEKIGNSNLFRRLLIQHTAKINNFNLLLENNVKEYVEDLLLSCNVKVN